MYVLQEGDKIVPLEICLLRKISDIDGVIRLLDFYEMPETFVFIFVKIQQSIYALNAVDFV